MRNSSGSGSASPPCVLGRERIGRVIPQLLVPMVTWYTNFSCLITETGA